MADINNEQRKALSKIVESNGTYSDFYEVKYAKKDADLIKRNQKDIDAYNSQDEACDKLEEKQNEEIKALNEKHQKALNAEKVKRNAIGAKLKEAGLEERGGGWNYRTQRDEKAGWGVDTSRFQHEYNTWQKSIIAEIWATDTAKNAQKLVKKFLTGIGKDEPVVQDATV